MELLDSVFIYEINYIFRIIFQNYPDQPDGSNFAFSVIFNFILFPFDNHCFRFECSPDIRYCPLI